MKSPNRWSEKFSIRLLTAMLATFLLSSCALVDGGDDLTRLRVQNTSSQTMSDIEVGYPEADLDFGSLGPGAGSEYTEISAIYSYAYLFARVEGRELRRQPVDWVGEKPLGPGDYTILLGIREEDGDPDHWGLNFELRKD